VQQLSLYELIQIRNEFGTKNLGKQDLI
jgi:hypothetical protein